MTDDGRLVPVHDTRLYVVQRGDPGGFPVLVLHGGPGLDHHEFADYLDPLTAGGRYRLVLVDQRAQGRSERDCPPQTWTIEQMASDVSAVAADVADDDYAVLGHSFGAIVALRHAVDAPGAARATVVSGGLADAGAMQDVQRALAEFEPVRLRDQVTKSWAAEEHVTTEDEVAALMHAQMPFHFADPTDPRIAEYERRSAGARYAPDVLRHFATNDYGDLDVRDRLSRVSQPVLVCTGRRDRTTPVAAAERIASGIAGSRLVVFEESGHMTFVEENERYLQVVRGFLDEALGF